MIDQVNTNSDEKNAAYTAKFIFIPALLSMIVFIISIRYDYGTKCFVVDSELYKLWLPNFSLSIQEITAFFGIRRSCTYFSTVTSFGFLMTIWAFWKTIHEFRRKGSENEVKGIYLFAILSVPSLIMFFVDFVDFDGVVANSYSYSIYRNIAISVFYILVFFLNFSFVISAIVEKLRKFRALDSKTSTE